MTDRVRLLLVGCGAWGKNYVAAARESGEAEVVGIITRCNTLTREMLGSGARLYDARRGDLDEALEECDAVIYAGHPSGARVAVEAALAAGRPVLCEKPAGLSLADAMHVAHAADASGLPFLVGHQHLFHPALEFARDVAQRDPVKTLVASYGGFGPMRDYSALWDYGPHAISIAAALMGDPYKVTLAGYSDADEHRLALEYPGDRVALLCASRVKEQKTRLFIFSTRGDRTIEYVDTTGELFLDRKAVHVRPGRPLTLQIGAFVRAVRAGGTDDWRFGGRWATRVAAVLQRADDLAK